MRRIAVTNLLALGDLVQRVGEGSSHDGSVSRDGPRIGYRVLTRMLDVRYHQLTG